MRILPSPKKAQTEHDSRSEVRRRVVKVVRMVGLPVSVACIVGCASHNPARTGDPSARQWNAANKVLRTFALTRVNGVPLPADDTVLHQLRIPLARIERGELWLMDSDRVRVRIELHLTDLDRFTCSELRGEVRAATGGILSLSSTLTKADTDATCASLRRAVSDFTLAGALRGDEVFIPPSVDRVNLSDTLGTWSGRVERNRALIVFEPHLQPDAGVQVEKRALYEFRSQIDSSRSGDGAPTRGSAARPLFENSR